MAFGVNPKSTKKGGLAWYEQYLIWQKCFLTCVHFRPSVRQKSVWVPPPCLTETKYELFFFAQNPYLKKVIRLRLCAKKKMLIFCFSETKGGGGYQTDFCLTEGRKWTHVGKHFCQIKYCSYHANPPFLVDFGLTQNTILVEKYFISRYYTIFPLPIL